VFVTPTQVHVTDWVEGPPVELRLSLPTQPGAHWDSDKSIIGLGDERFRLAAPEPIKVVSGREQPFTGWWSETYGKTVTAPLLTMSTTADSLSWSVALASDEGIVSVSDFAVRFESDSVRLRVITKNGTFLRSVAL
jgi:hypothetical protein